MKPVRDLDCTFHLHDRTQLACLVSVCPLEQGGVIVSLRENRRIREITRRIVGTQARYTFDTIQGTSRAIQDALHLARIASRSDSTTLILGESGTGKELFAQAIHNASERASGPFVAVNCGAIPRDLVQSELFGHVEGAFTGSARGGSAGKFELADGGTIFLDEIGDMSFDAQVKLAARVAGGRNRRGSARTSASQVDVRIIAATHRNLSQAVAEGAFREDLYYRLNVLNLTRAAAARCAAKTFRCWRGTSFALRPLAAKSGAGFFPGGRWPCFGLRLAGQCARAGKRHRTGDQPGHERTDPTGRPTPGNQAARTGASLRTPARPGPEQPRDARHHRCAQKHPRQYPPGRPPTQCISGRAVQQNEPLGLKAGDFRGV